MTLLYQYCTECGRQYKIEADMLGTADDSLCVPCLRMGFVLRPEPPRPARPAPTRNGPATVQKALFGGLDCLPGQLDLFQTDGEEVSR